jgi:hypothetical protein
MIFILRNYPFLFYHNKFYSLIIAHALTMKILSLEIDVLDVLTASIIMTRWWRHWTPVKRQSISMRIHGATSQKTVIFIITARRICLKFHTEDMEFTVLMFITTFLTQCHLCFNRKRILWRWFLSYGIISICFIAMIFIHSVSHINIIKRRFLCKDIHIIFFTITFVYSLSLMRQW